jgi:hypothetical protein
MERLRALMPGGGGGRGRNNQARHIMSDEEMDRNVEEEIARNLWVRASAAPARTAAPWPRTACPRRPSVAHC